MQSKPLQSYDGKVGAKFEEYNVFVTTPNMSIIYSPLLESRRVHMRRQRHFGQDDPLIHPQPYNPNHGHLAVIPYPLLQDKDSTYILFLPINPSQDFSPLNSSQPQGLGHIKLDKRQVLTAECKSLRKRVARQCTTDAEERPDERGVKDDSFIRSYDSQIRYLLGRLNLPALSEEAATVFTLLQRIHLELTARLEWLTTYRQFWRTSDARRRPLANVVGALTDDLVVAQNMFHAGIPVWLVRPLHCIPPDGQTGLRVDKWVDGDALYLKDGLPSRDTGLTLTLDENDPPHPDVFTGPARSTKRFVAMGKYIHHLATSHVYTTGEDDASTATKMALPPTASSAGPSRTEPSLATKRAQPYNKAKSSKPSSSPAERKKMSSSPAERNKFMDVVAPVMPRGLPTWMEASRQAGVGFNPQEIPLPGVDNGYSLPDPNTLVVKNEETSTSFFTMWLKLRTILLYLLRTPRFKPLRSNQWRTILGLGHFSSAANTKTAHSRQALQDLLQTSLEREAMEALIDFTNLDAMPMEIDDLRITGLMLHQVALKREVLWELFEINFRCELVRLDRLCYRFLAKDGEDVSMEDGCSREQGELGAADLVSSPAEREMQVLSLIPHFDGALIPGNAKEDARLGFAAESWEKRREAWWGLYQVMLGWKDQHAMSEGLREGGRGLEPGRRGWEPAMKDLQSALALHYCNIFRNVFVRAPLLPHGL